MCHVLYLDFYIRALILLYTCRHTNIYMTSYYCICALTLLYMCPHTVWQVWVRGHMPRAASVQREDIKAMQRGSGGASAEELKGQ
jgi:hypothetical protein